MKWIKGLLVCFLLLGCQGKETTEKKEEKKENKVSMLAVGDNLMHQRLLDCAKTDQGYDFKPYYSHIQSYIKKADLSFVNQETVLGGKNLSYTGYPNFNTPDEMAANLKDVGFDIINGATNHSLDKGKKGLLHSIEEFKKYKELTYIGLYESQEARDNIAIVEKNGIKIAFLSYNQMNNGHKMPNQYCMNLFDEEQMKKDVENAKEISDFVIVSCHWGNEYDTEANSFQKKYAKILADANVDVIIGTHSHTLQPVEWIQGEGNHKTLVAYSLGNFVSGMMEEETQLEGMLTFDLKKDENGCVIENATLTPLVNHYEVSNKKDYVGTRKNFTVYRLKDYSEDLAKQHGLNGYENISISLERMKKKVTQRITSDINIDM